MAFGTTLGLATSLLMCAALMWHRTSWPLTRHLRHGELIRRAMLMAYGSVTVLGLASWRIGQPALSSEATDLSIVALVVTLLVSNIGLVAAARIKAVATNQPKRLLAIGAHPDDLELACGGTLARLIDMGHQVHCVVMSRGGNGGRADVRLREAENGARRMGALSVTVHDFPDTNLVLTSREMTLAIEKEIAHHSPDIIVTHSAHDQHQDHQAVHHAALRAARRHHSILCFESPSVTPEFKPTVFFDVSDYIAIKQGAVAAHRDQIRQGRAYMSRERVHGTAVFRGGQVRRRRAEGFEVVRLLADETGVV